MDLFRILEHQKLKSNKLTIDQKMLNENNYKPFLDEFKTNETEKKLREEIKILEGIIPICSYCK